jgi:hypothetical protein
MNQPDFPDNLPNGERYRHWQYNPVTVNAPNTVGVVILGLICIILIIMLRRQLNEASRSQVGN